MNYKLSIVLSTYNGEYYVLEQLQSLLKQIRQADEVLIFDDCSTDATPRIVDAFITHNNLKTWKLFINAKNKGWKKNFIDGINKSSGDLIFPCDQDDIWEENKLFYMEKVMLNHCDINLLVADYFEYFNNGNIRMAHKNNKSEIYKAGYKNGLFNVPYPGCTFCIRKKFAQRVTKYWRKNYPHDALFWRMALLEESAYILNKPLVKWRKHIDSTYAVETNNAKNRDKKEEWILYAIDFLDCMNLYVLNENICDSNTKLRIINKYRKWCDLRQKFYKSSNPVYGFKLISYLNLYSRSRQYVGDWVITYIWK